MAWNKITSLCSFGGTGSTTLFLQMMLFSLTAALIHKFSIYMLFPREDHSEDSSTGKNAALIFKITIILPNVSPSYFKITESTTSLLGVSK